MVSNVTVPEDGAVHLYHTDPVAELRTEGFCSDVCIIRNGEVIDQKKMKDFRMI